MPPSPMLRRLKLLRVIRFALIGLAVGGVLGYVNFLIVDARPGANVAWGLLAGFMVGATVGVMEVFVFFGRARRTSFGRLLAIRLLAYGVTLSAWLTAANAYRLGGDRGAGMAEAARFYLVQGSFRRDFVLVAIASLVFVWILHAGQFHRGGDLLRFILGRYHKPREAEMVLLFVDLTASTAIAEDLGPLAYSAFLQDFFFDLNTALLPWKGSVYQYVGDEVIVVWSVSSGTANAACVQCFFAMRDIVAANRERYVSEYGVCPEFRGGLHVGGAVLTWVGEIKKEIVYHGDVLNTAARILGEAKGTEYPCLVSGDLMARMDLPEGLTSVALGDIALRGREGRVTLFGVGRVDPV